MHPPHVCHLLQGNLWPQAGTRAWYRELHQFLLHYGFTNSHAHTFLFISTTRGAPIYILIYVDDIAVIGAYNFTVQQFITMHAQFLSQKSRPSNLFLDIEVVPHQNGFILSQHRYISDLLRHTKMCGAKPIATLLATTLILLFLAQYSLILPSIAL